MRNQVDPQLENDGVDRLSQLPVELHEAIFSFLQTKDVLTLARVNKLFYYNFFSFLRKQVAPIDVENFVFFDESIEQFAKIESFLKGNEDFGKEIVEIVEIEEGSHYDNHDKLLMDYRKFFIKLLKDRTAINHMYPYPVDSYSTPRELTLLHHLAEKLCYLDQDNSIMLLRSLIYLFPTVEGLETDVKKKLDINMQDSEGSTALHILSARYEKLKNDAIFLTFFYFSLQHGFNINIKDKYGRTFLSILFEKLYRNPKISKMESLRSVIRAIKSRIPIDFSNFSFNCLLGTYLEKQKDVCFEFKDSYLKITRKEREAYILAPFLFEHEEILISYLRGIRQYSTEISIENILRQEMCLIHVFFKDLCRVIEHPTDEESGFFSYELFKHRRSVITAITSKHFIHFEQVFRLANQHLSREDVKKRIEELNKVLAHFKIAPWVMSKFHIQYKGVRCFLGVVADRMQALEEKLFPSVSQMLMTQALSLFSRSESLFSRSEERVDQEGAVTVSEEVTTRRNSIFNYEPRRHVVVPVPEQEEVVSSNNPSS